ncbi:hypothetical protein RFI_07795 [Reticulomyxa filosa]|uniref:Uncharacterized protein n=1 Tax=Reticulomyxa filosa TaxID=46433 RepID=X6NU61_RETFI|nr:hypothetical protein RFI_07795 [Reticulomyxa filosa]|eukprot:ETO29324.1 hypothetical protein RFI_07795 [Reticulomyxa filosa]
MNPTFGMNTQTLPYLGSNYSYGRLQQPQPYVASNFSYPASMVNTAHNFHAGIPNNGYNEIVSVSQCQSEISRAYQMKQEQLWISHQRNVEEINHMNSYPHIRHHCVITDRLDKDDSRYTNFTKQVENNERLFDANDDTFEDRNYIAQKMNAQRLSALNIESGNLSRNSSRESFIRDNCECGDDSDEDRANNVSDYVSTPSTTSSVSNDDSLPLCNPGDNSMCVTTCEKNVTDQRRVTCLGLLEDWCGQMDERNKPNEKTESDKEQQFVIDYAWINEELDKLETAREEKVAQHTSTDIIPSVVHLPVQVQLAVPIDHPVPWMNATYAMPMPMIHFPFQTYIPTNVGMGTAFNVNVVNSNNYYINEQLGYFA